MITKLNNFTLKSFVGYTNPNDLLFRVKNILFGYNGKGKSAIAIGIKDEFLKDQAKKPENLRTFDRDYISNSLYSTIFIDDSDEELHLMKSTYNTIHCVNRNSFGTWKDLL